MYARSVASRRAATPSVDGVMMQVESLSKSLSDIEITSHTSDAKMQQLAGRLDDLESVNYVKQDSDFVHSTVSQLRELTLKVQDLQKKVTAMTTNINQMTKQLASETNEEDPVPGRKKKSTSKKDVTVI